MGIILSIPVLFKDFRDKRKARKAAKKLQEGHSKNNTNNTSTPQTQTNTQRLSGREQEQGRSGGARAEVEVEGRGSADIFREGLKTTSPGGKEIAAAEQPAGSRTDRDTTATAAAERQQNQQNDLSIQRTHNTNITMASDSDYASFLDKVNADPSGGVVKSQGGVGGKKKEGFKTTDASVKVPTVLKKAVVDAYYVSEGDEPFEVVGLEFEGGKLPDEKTFAQLIEHPEPGKAEVQILDVAEWDPQGDYKEQVDAVREASKGGDVRVYKVVRDRTRVEYWVLSVEGGSLVGVKALGVES